MSDLPYTLLIVDDCAADRELYRRALLADRSTYHLLEAESVAAGLELYHSHKIDAVILDYLLPDADGLEFLETLVGDGNGRMPPIVMMTGHGNESIAVRAIKSGAADYLVKRNLTPEVLRLTVRNAIENARLRLQLQHQKQRFQTAIENMLDCFGIYSAIRDSAGQIVDFRLDYLNAAAMQSNRMADADMGKTLCEVLPAHRETGLLAEYVQVVETGIALVKENLVYADVFGGKQLTNAYHMQVAKLDDGIVISWRDITAQKQAELSLTAANQQITTIWESMTDAYVTLDRDWRVVYTNSAAVEVYRQTTGLLPAEYLGSSHWELFPATVGTIVDREYHRAVIDRVAVHLELFHQPTETWFEIHAYPSDVGLGIYFRDINERKQSELARLAAEQERDRFFDVSIDLLVVANHDEYFVRVNPASEQLLGFTSAEMMAQPLLDFVHPEDRAATRAVYKDLTTGNVLVNFENRYRCKDGSYRWILWSAIPDVERQLIYASGRDITERKRDEELLRQSEELTRRILESNRDCIKVVDLAGRLIYMNDYGQSLMEIDDFDTVAESQWLEFWQDRDRESARTAFSVALAGGVERFEGYCATAKGMPKWWEVIVTPILGADGQVGQILSVSRDVTERQQAASLLQAQQATIGQQLGEIESIYQMAPVGLCFVDTDFRYVRINEQLAQINGLSVAEHIGKTFREVLPELVDTMEPVYRQVIESGTPIIDLEVTGTNRAQPGVDRCWLASFYPQTDERGRVIGVNNVVQEITDRKRLEAARLSAEQERDRFFDRSIDLLSIGNFEGYFERINPAFERLLGFTETEFLSRPFSDFVHPDDRESTLAAAHSLANGQIVVDFENRCQCQDGSYVWVSWNATPYQQSNCWYGVGRDITDRKQLEAQLRQRESQLQLFVKYVPAGLAMFDRDMCYLSASDVWIDCHELRQRDIVGRSHYDLYPNLPQEWKEIHQRCLAGAIESREEDLFPRPDGAIDWVRWEARPWYTDTDEIGGIIMFSEIITDLKLRSVALLQSERKFSAIFNQTFQLMGLVSLDGVLLEANHAALRSVAATESEIIGKSFWDAPWWHTEQLQQQLRDAIATAAGGRFVRYEVEFLNPSGGVTITDFSLKPMFDEVGRVESIVAEAHDITDRKQAQATLEERNQELDSFVYVVSHDLKAPLRAVANLSEWIEDDLEEQLTATTRSQMSLLRSRVNRMAATIDGLLDYARVGRGEDTLEPVAVAQLLADVIDSVAPPPTFTIALPAELPTISARRLPLFQVLVNLVGNGIKHHHSETGTIGIALAERGDWYEFAVSDDGAGIAPENQERMFKIFQAVNPQQRSDSTGIGLAIVKKIIEVEGGTIYLESQLGKGTTFYFTWPKRVEGG